MKNTLAGLIIACQLLFGSSALLAESAADRSPESKRDDSKQSDNKSMNDFLGSLMNKMTLEEKIGQLNLPSVGFDITGPVVSEGVDEKIKKGLVGGVFNTYTPIAVRKLQEMAVNQTRLKIPLLFGYDVIHGHRTIFPIPLALSSSWNMDLIERTARAAAEEASADGVNWTFSPMVDIARDPRWGRVSEGAGEDPYLGCQVAKAMVRGYQGDSYSSPDRILACVKHFALYGAAEAGRDYNTVDMSPIRMYNEYLPPYKAAVEAGVASAMSSFNEINGVPATGNKWLITELLRNQWKFPGFVVTDYTAINEMINHGAGDEAKVAELALNAGIDMDMVGELFLKHASDLIKSGRVPQETVDRACRRILEAKYKLGLFADPYKFVSEKRAKEEMMTEEKLALSKEAAIKSMVLLKNENNVLPLSQTKKIAFIGPHVKDQENKLGSWAAAGDWKKAVSLWQALEKEFGPNKFLFAKGCNMIDDPVLLKRLKNDGVKLSVDDRSPAQLIEEAVQTASQADIVVVALGELSDMSGEAACRSMIGLPENQLDLLKALKKTEKPILLLLFNGRPLTLNWESENCDGILEAWFPGTQAGSALVDVLFGKANPSGRLSMSFPYNVGQIPIYYAHKNTGRPFDPLEKYKSKYMDVPNDPLYPFGYGLSYSNFEYGDLKLDKTELRDSQGQTDCITASITVKNTDKVSGVETVQLYIQDLVGSVTRPVKELKGFNQIELQPGETKTVSFTIKVDDLKFYNSELKYLAEPGEFKVYVGANSKEAKPASFKLLD